MLFYTDFAHYKYTGYSVSGCKYVALNYGSVPDDYSLILAMLESYGYISVESIIIKEKEHEKFIPLKAVNLDLFSGTELDILEKVLEKFKSLSTTEIMNIAHEEKAWLDNIQHKSLIDFAIYAPQLIAL